MRLSRQQTIRSALLEAEDGLTAQQIGARINSDVDSTRKTLSHMWGVYVDRWANSKRGMHHAVYMCVEVPEDAPKPEPKVKKK